MATFFARQYMRPIEAVGNTEKLLGILIVLLAATVVTTFVLQVATNDDHLFEVEELAYVSASSAEVGAEADTATRAAAGATNPFPDPGLEGWHAPERVDRFTADDLYMKIDGRAAAYLEAHVVALTFGRYCHQDNAERTVDVYWYDMGAPSNALSMFESEEAPDATPVSIGRASYQAGGAVFFCQASSYVQVLPAGLTDADAQAALSIARRLAKQIEGQ